MIKVTYYYENLPQAIFNVELDDDTNLDEWETYNKCKIKSWERDGYYNNVGKFVYFNNN